MKKIILIIFLLWAQFAVAQVTSPNVLVKANLIDVRPSDKIGAIETYYGKKIQVAKLKMDDASDNVARLLPAKKVLELLDEKETLVLKTGKVVATDDIEYAYILKNKKGATDKVPATDGTTEGNVQIKSPNAAQDDTVNKHPNTDGTAGTNSH